MLAVRSAGGRSASSKEAARDHPVLGHPAIASRARAGAAVLLPVFADHELVIVEDFGPYVFRSNDAAARWDAGFATMPDDG
jgi:hypothetical protein